MDETERLLERDRMMHTAMYDSYMIITNKIDPFTYILEKDAGDEDFVLLFNIEDMRSLTKNTLENIIDYFAELEEYEMCAELVAYKRRRGWK